MNIDHQKKMLSTNLSPVAHQQGETSDKCWVVKIEQDIAPL